MLNFLVRLIVGRLGVVGWSVVLWGGGGFEVFGLWLGWWGLLFIMDFWLFGDVLLFLFEKDFDGVCNLFGGWIFKVVGGVEGVCWGGGKFLFGWGNVLVWLGVNGGGLFFCWFGFFVGMLKFL